MKKTLSLLIIFLWIQLSGINANTPESTAFEELINVTLSKLNSNNAPDRFLTCVAELKRISAIYPEEWLTYYYISLYEIQQSFNDHSKNSENLLNDALTHIELLKHDKKADLSEVITLEGYYYYALIASNPARNGQLYYRNVLEAYQKALKYNPENPRTQLLLLIFKLNMARYTEGEQDEDVLDQLTHIQELFNNERDGSLKPSWGENTLIAMKNKFSNQ